MRGVQLRQGGRRLAGHRFGQRNGLSHNTYRYADRFELRREGPEDAGILPRHTQRGRGRAVRTDSYGLLVGRPLRLDGGRGRREAPVVGVLRRVDDRDQLTHVRPAADVDGHALVDDVLVDGPAVDDATDRRELLHRRVGPRTHARDQERAVRDLTARTALSDSGDHDHRDDTDQDYQR